MYTPFTQQAFWLKLAKYGCWMSLVSMIFLTMGHPVSLADEQSQVPNNYNIDKTESSLALTDHNFLMPQLVASGDEVKEIRTVVITAYSSRVVETDNDPFITASGKWVRDGIVASNDLPFGTKIHIPNLFEDKIFVVEDRMNERYDENHIDIWFTETEDAKDFGVKYAVIEIL